MNCFQLFEGEDIVSVKRLGLTLSTFRKIKSEEVISSSVDLKESMSSVGKSEINPTVSETIILS